MIMPDLLTHILLGYTAGTFLSAYYEEITAEDTAVVMVGTLLPDLNHIYAIIQPEVIHNTIGVPFSWGFLQTGGGVFLTSLGAILFVSEEYRRRGFGLIWVGAITHLVSDVLLYVPDGRSQSVFWPLTMYQPSTPGIYMSTDLWPLLAAALLAVISSFVVEGSDLKE